MAACSVAFVLTGDLWAQSRAIVERGAGKTSANFQVIDPKAFRSGGAFSTDLYVVGGGFAGLIGLMIVYAIYRSIRNKLTTKRLKRYKQKKMLSKMSALNMSSDSADALTDIAKRTGNKVDELLADNRLYEKALNELKAQNPADPLLGYAQTIREQADFVFSNPKVNFVVTQMLEVGQEVRVFVTHQGKEHSFVTRLLRVTNSELWLRPPKIKGKVVKLTSFKRFELRVYRPQDGEYHMFCDLRRQISKPVDALIIGHALQVMRMNHRKQERIAVELERKIAYVLPKQNTQFSFGEFEAVQNTVTLVDLSSGGARLVTEGLPEGVDIGTEVLMVIPETGLRKKLRSHIVRIDKEPEGKLIFLHLMFSNLNERDRHQMEKFIHNVNAGAQIKKKRKVAMPPQVKAILGDNSPTDGFTEAVNGADQSGQDDQPVERTTKQSSSQVADMSLEDSEKNDADPLDENLDLDEVLHEAANNPQPGRSIEEVEDPDQAPKGMGETTDKDAPIEDDLDLSEDDGMHFNPDKDDEI
ncbi:MAG: PilZ domain-containing protein [bacterium]|nr:PilZ domain-containing protein [bacterium]